MQDYWCCTLSAAYKVLPLEMWCSTSWDALHHKLHLVVQHIKCCTITAAKVQLDDAALLVQHNDALLIFFRMVFKMEASHQWRASMRRVKWRASSMTRVFVFVVLLKEKHVNIVETMTCVNEAREMTRLINDARHKSRFVLLKEKHVNIVETMTCVNEAREMTRLINDARHNSRVLLLLKKLV
jgi:hypothetical protein